MGTSDQKTSTGLDPNIAGLLCYVLGWITGIIFLVIEKDNRFIRFHAIQSIVVFGVYTIASVILGWIPGLGWIIDGFLWIAAFILWIILMVSAFQGRMLKILWAGDIAEKQANSMPPQTPRS